MIDETHPNHVDTYVPTAEQFDLMIAQSTGQVLGKLEADRRANEWPGHVNRLLLLAATRIADLESRMAVLEADRG